MTTIVFRDGDWDVATPAWAIGTKDQGRIVLCYPWSAASGAGFTANATGTARTALAIDMDEFLRRVAEGGVVDLRDVRSMPR